MIAAIQARSKHDDGPESGQNSPNGLQWLSGPTLRHRSSRLLECTSGGRMSEMVFAYGSTCARVDFVATGSFLRGAGDLHRFLTITCASTRGA
jgi:hypothetical protein